MTFIKENLQETKGKIDKTSTNYNIFHYMFHNLRPDQVNKNKLWQRSSKAKSIDKSYISIWNSIIQ